MQITRSRQGPVVVLALFGPLVEAEADLLAQSVEECYNEGATRLVLDLARVPFVDSAGLEMLQTLVGQAGRRGGDFRIATINDVCRDIFEATRMSGLLQLYDSRDAAVRSLL